MSYTDINAKTIDRWVDEGWQWGQPIDHLQYVNAKNGHWDVVLTPTKPVPHEWFNDLKNKKILGLAAGGGQQMPIFAALGANCTVLDYSIKQIESELMVANREGYQIEALRFDITKPLPFADNTFDLIFHPVANCYIEDIMPIWKECYRVLKPKGRLLAGLDNGINFLFDEDENCIVHKLPFNPLKNPEQMKILEKDDSGIQFSHTLEEQIRYQLKVGFKLLDLYEDYNGYGFLQEYNVPTYWSTLAEK